MDNIMENWDLSKYVIGLIQFVEYFRFSINFLWHIELDGKLQKILSILHLSKIIK